MIQRLIITLTFLLASQLLAAQEAQPKIIGGEDANSQWHTLVALIQKPLKEQAAAGGAQYPVFQAQFCGGTLLSENWVMTAAHCVESGTTSGNPANLEVLVGTHSLAGSPNSELLLQVQSIHRHPGYNASTSRNDIALLRLAEPANPSLSDQASAVLALPETDTELEDAESYDEILTALGWGVVSYNTPDRTGPVYALDLQEVNLDFVTNENCQDLYTANAPGQDPIFSTMICAYEPDFDDGEDPFGEDSCQADSGGPLFLNGSGPRDDNPQFGITSFGYECGDFTLPGVYTRVSQFLGWIEQVTSFNGIEMRNLTIGDDDGQNQGINNFPITIPVENTGTLSATGFSLTIQHSKDITLSASQAGLECAAASSTLTECTYTGSAIAGGSTTALSLNADDNGGRSTGSEAMPVTVTLDKHRDYHRLDDSGTVTLYFGEPLLQFSAEAVCLTPGASSSQMRVEATLNNTSTQIDSLGTQVSGTLPETLTLVGNASPACDFDSGDVVCELGEIEAGEEGSTTIGVTADPETMETLTLALGNDNGLAVGSSLSVDVELDFTREDLEECPVIPTTTARPTSGGGSSGGGGAFQLLTLLLLGWTGLARRR